MRHTQSRSYQQNDLSKEFPQERQRTKQTERQSRIVVDLIKLISFACEYKNRIKKLLLQKAFANPFLNYITELLMF
jgi:hypothetical protein